jgi:hypothetical protein
VSYIIINFDYHTTALYKFGNPITPFDGETFHPKDLMEEGPFDFVVSLFKIYFEENSIKLFRMKLMNGRMQYYNPFQNVSTRNEGSLGGLYDFLGHPSNSVCPNFGKKN